MEEHYIFGPKLCRMYTEDHEELSRSFMWAKAIWKLESVCTQIVKELSKFT